MANVSFLNRKTMATPRDTTVPLLQGSGDDSGETGQGPLTVHVCTSAQQFNVQGLIDEIGRRFPRLVGSVEYVKLPYNDLDDFTFEGLDAVVLCHSIHNRRFAITDVMDALYNDFLKNARAEKDRKAISMVAVIAHDFPDERLWTNANYYEMNMDAFRSRQPTAFECADVAMLAGRLDGCVELSEERWKQLEDALEHATKPVLMRPSLTPLIWQFVVCAIMTIMNILDSIPSTWTWLEILFGVANSVLFGVNLFIATSLLYVIKELKRVAIRTSCLVVSAVEIVLFCSKIFIEDETWNYVGIVLCALPLVPVGIGVLDVYRHRHGLTKLMKTEIRKCAVIVAAAYCLFVWGIFV